MLRQTLKKVLYHAGSGVVKAYSKIMLKLDVARRNYIPRGVKIFAANHPTTIDPFILTSVSRGQACVLIKDTLFSVPVFGKYLHLAGHIPVSKTNGKEAFRKALENLRKGISVVVFIEGGLSDFIHKIKKSKTGAIRLALISGKPIIPIGIGVKEENIKKLKSVIKGIEEWGKWYFNGPYAISIGKPINIIGDIKNRKKVKFLSGQLSRQISKLAKESRNRMVKQVNGE